VYIYAYNSSDNFYCLAETYCTSSCGMLHLSTKSPAALHRLSETTSKYACSVQFMQHKFSTVNNSIEFLTQMFYIIWYGKIHSRL